MTIREKILVIEDEKSISHFISTVLNNNGYEAMQAQTGEEALSMISSHCPDLVILDLGLPDMDGLDILRSLRSWSSLPAGGVSAPRARGGGACPPWPRHCLSRRPRLRRPGVCDKRVRAAPHNSRLAA